MTILRVQCNIPRDSGLPEDDCINTWHFLTVGAATPATAADNAVTQLGVFYAAIDTFLAAYTATPMRFKVYDLEDVEPRVPILQTTLTLTPGGGAAFPAECAIVLSYRAENLSGANPARRRGRIYLGPLDADVAVTGIADMNVSPTTRGAIASAAADIVVAGQTGTARWVVFSPTLAGPPPWSSATLENASADVVAGFIDDSFDTVRSRGGITTVRTTWDELTP